MDYSAMIQNRKSFRAFLDTPVTTAALNEINRYFLNDCKRLIPSIDVEIEIFKGDVKEQLEGSAGYRDFMIGASCYLVVLSEDAEFCTENAGYLTEDLVLRMTDLNLSTCWLTFNDGEDVKKALGIKSDKHIAALVAFGYGKKTSKKIRLNVTNRSKVDIEVRQEYYSPHVGVDNMVSMGKWGNKEGLYDVIGDMESTLWRGFYAASLAPSYLNRQPYGFVIDKGMVVLVETCDEYTDPYSEKLNLGIVMLHFVGVVSQMLNPVTWVMGPYEHDLGLPEGCRVVASCKVY